MSFVDELGASAPDSPSVGAPARLARLKVVPTPVYPPMFPYVIVVSRSDPESLPSAAVVPSISVITKLFSATGSITL